MSTRDLHVSVHPCFVFLHVHSLRTVSVGAKCECGFACFENVEIHKNLKFLRLRNSRFGIQDLHSHRQQELLGFTYNSHQFLF